MNQPNVSTDLVIGEKVTWTHSISNGNHFRFRVRTGTLVEIHPNNVIVRYRGKEIWVARETLRKAGQKNALTEAFEAIAKEVE